jgi:hypothetical protein
MKHTNRYKYQDDTLGMTGVNTKYGVPCIVQLTNEYFLSEIQFGS